MCGVRHELPNNCFALSKMIYKTSNAVLVGGVALFYGCVLKLLVLVLCINAVDDTIGQSDNGNQYKRRFQNVGNGCENFSGRNNNVGTVRFQFERAHAFFYAHVFQLQIEFLE